jgi:proline iminopeptidase
VFGGSWGATLALAYAQTHASAVLGLVLRGVFLGRQRDLDWFFGPDGAARLLPDAWCSFRDAVSPGSPRAVPRDLIKAYRRAVHGEDPELAARAALAWTAWADRVACWDRAPEQGSVTDEPRATSHVLAKAKIETHFAHRRYFLDEGQLLANTSRIPPVPVSIVHGSRDLVCPVASAWELHRAVPGSRLTVVPQAGHLASEPAMIDALVGETDRLRTILG